MTHSHPLLSWAVALALSAASLGAHAHGSEPHDHVSPVVTAPVAGAPRLSVATDLFELVARLEPAALRVWIQRFETSEPVLQAQLELESGPLKATAQFEPASSAYVVTDAKLVQALAQPGEHPLVFTVLAGKDADLMPATLSVPAAQVPNPSSPPMWALVAGGSALVLLGAAGLALAMRRVRARRPGDRP